jgi:hypothetical protein
MPGLTPERLQLFIASLSGLVPEEVRKAKVLFLRNEIASLRATLTTHSGMAVTQGCFAIIPIFWPVLFAQRKAMSAASTLQIEQLRNALDVWREDLEPDTAALRSEIESLARK